MALTAIYVQFIAKERFRSFAHIMLREQLKVTDAEREPLTPVTFKALLLNEDLIRKVRNEYRDKLDLIPTALKLEKFKKSFQVDSEIVQDTTIKMQYSPVMILSTDAGTPENAKLLLEIWLRHFMQRYGDILPREADFYSRYYTEKAEKVQKDLEEKETRFLELKRQIPFKIRQLTTKEWMIFPAPVNFDIRDERRSYYKFRDQNRTEVSVPETANVPEQEGLEQKLMTIDLELAKAEAGNDATRTAQLQAERKALVNKITELTGDIKKLQKEIADMEKEFETLSREVTGSRDLYQYLIDLRNQYEPDSGALHFEKANLEERADVMILAEPTLADMRFYPKKTVTCLIAGLIGLLLCTIAVVFDKYMLESSTLVKEGEKS